jgi:two-component system, NtrC family, response regulator AtoC
VSQERVLVVDDEEKLRRVLDRELAAMGYRARQAGDAEEALALLESEDISVVLLDLKMPKRGGLEVLPEIKGRWPNVEVIILTGHGSIETAISALRAGAYDYLQKPCHLDELELVVGKAVEKRRLVQHTNALVGGQLLEEIEWGESESMGRVRSDLEKVAPTDAPVLILGESGTGKELVARELHARSGVAAGRFVVVNCGAIPPSLVESTLFGHEEGAFTGASSRKLGLVEVADGGTLFLDEVGELPVQLQVKLLRFLQCGEVLRVGATETRTVHVRIVAATNVDIDVAVEQGEFRSDLLYRLETIRLELPPLRERPGDIRRLTRRFLRELADKGRPSRTFTEAALQRLDSHTWPGNVRELRHVVERLSILSDGEIIAADDLSRRLGNGHRRAEPADPLIPIRDMERRLIQLALQRFKGDKPQAAKALGIALKTLYNKIKAYEVDVERAVAEGPAPR